MSARASGPAGGTGGVTGIVGLGHFGGALARLLESAGKRYVAHDARGAAVSGVNAGCVAADLGEVAQRAGVIVVCVPVPALEGVLRALVPMLGPSHLVMDVGSVKERPAREMARVLGAAVPWCATHPLFGPAALQRGERPLRAVVCANGVHAGAHGRARAFYEELGCEVLEQTPEEHDALMAETHALAFFVARAMQELGAGEGAAFVPPSFRAMAQTIETVRVDAGHLFEVIQRDNAYAGAARARLMDALARIDGELTGKDREG